MIGTMGWVVLVNFILAFENQKYSTATTTKNSDQNNY